MGKIYELNSKIAEVEELIRKGISWLEAIEEIKKSYPQSDKDIENNQDNKITCSIAENEDIDNGEIFQIESGITKKDL